MPDIAHLFNRNVQFNGTLLYGDGQEMEGNCRAVFNPIDPSENEVRFRRSFSPAAVEEFIRGGDLMQGSVEIEGESGDCQYVFEGRVVNSDINTQRADYRLKPNDLNEVLVTAGTDKSEGLQQTTKFFLPPFDELYRAFARTSFRHYQHGYVCGWIPESLDDLENGRWASSSKEIEIGGRPVEIGNAFKFEEAVANFSESTIVAPTIRIKREVPDPSLPETVRGVRQMTERVYEELMPLWSALRFALGRRADPPYQELTTHDYENGAILKGRRFWNRSNEVESRPGRATGADQLWNLVEELARRFDSLESDELQRAEKAVNRYVEAFEAPHLELKLTLLHSALHLILDGCEYDHGSNDVIPDDVPKPPNGGSVKWGLARFIGIHGIEWKDLFSDDVDHSEMYAFNRLRNDYLKRDRRGFLKSGKHVNVAQRLFERVFLAHYGLDPADYSVLGRV